MSEVHGQATIRIDGQVYETEDDAKLIIGGKKNSGRMIGQKFYHSQTVMPAQVTCKIGVDSSISLRQLQEAANVEIIFESDMGTSYIIRDAVQENELELTGGDNGGTTELSFKGQPAEEMR